MADATLGPTTVTPSEAYKMDELERLLKVCGEATPGPWKLGEGVMASGRFVAWVMVPKPAPPYPMTDLTGVLTSRADAEFIATFNPAKVSALLLEVGRLRDENEQLRLAICGGEDAPGYAASLPLETVLGVMRDNYASWKRDSELAWDGETAQSWKARAKGALSALEFYRDNWDWFPGDGETPTPSDPGSPPTFYEAEPNAALRADEGNRAREALLSPIHEGGSARALSHGLASGHSELEPDGRPRPEERPEPDQESSRGREVGGRDALLAGGVQRGERSLCPESSSAGVNGQAGRELCPASLLSPGERKEGASCTNLSAHASASEAATPAPSDLDGAKNRLRQIVSSLLDDEWDAWPAIRRAYQSIDTLDEVDTAFAVDLRAVLATLSTRTEAPADAQKPEGGAA